MTMTTQQADDIAGRVGIAAGVFVLAWMLAGHVIAALG